jgi:diguanylate cyclase (GGDEF)-like protein
MKVPLSVRVEAERFAIVSLSELPKRFAGTMLMIYLIWLSGQTQMALGLLAVTLVIEPINGLLMRRTPSAEDMAPSWVAAIYFFAAAFSMVGNTGTITLALSGQQGFYIAALLLICAAILVTTATFARMPTFFFVTGAPACLCLVIVALLGVKQDLAPSSWPDALAASFLALFLAALPFQLRKDAMASDKAVDKLRAQSVERLAQLEYLNRHDQLTGLLNRAAFESQLRAALQEAGPKKLVGLAMIDLNGFKPINDSFGHDAGDAVLVAFAQLLKSLETEACTAARLGGDEFALLMQADSHIEFQQVGQTVVDRAQAPVQFGDTELRVTASVGLASTDDPSTDPDALSADADQAMYQAKSTKSTEIIIFDDAQFAPRLSLKDRRLYEDVLRHRQIRPHYQPKLDLRDRRIVGFEALARWQRDEGEPVLPAQFIGDIEELGLMRDFTQAMLSQTLIDLSDWLQQGLDPGRVSVNINETVLATENGL